MQAYIYLHDIGEKQLKNLTKHLKVKHTSSDSEAQFEVGGYLVTLTSEPGNSSSSFLHISDLGLNGPVPIIHGNPGMLPSTTYPFEVVRDAEQFINNHAEVHGLPQPAARRGRAETPPIHLPASQNYKIVHQCHFVHIHVLLGNRGFWINQANKPTWWPDGVPFKCPKHPSR